MIRLTTCTVKHLFLCLLFENLILCLLFANLVLCLPFSNLVLCLLFANLVLCLLFANIVVFLSIGFYNSSINPFVSTLGIFFWLMNLPNWTITLYFSTSEFKLDTLLSGLACHSNYGEKFLLIRSDEYRKKKTSLKLAL